MIPIIKDIKILQKKSEPVTSVSEAREIINQLKIALSEKDGCGLSAIQIGIPKQVAILKSTKLNEIIPIINPEIVEASDQFDFFGEGCLSFPGVFVRSKRFETFIIKNQVIEGNTFRSETQVYYYDSKTKPELNNLEGIVVQHEMDHFLGLTILDFGLDRYGGTEIRKNKKVGRNDDCPCNSGKKFKKCCLGNGKFD
jgi:peptide deformylase